MDIPKQTALITGASKGMGKEFANLLASKNYNLVLIALENNLLQAQAHEISEKYQVSVYTITKDLSQHHAAQEIFTEVNDKNIDIHILINNAGFGIKGKFCEIDNDKTHDMMVVNMIALTELTKLFIPKMVDRHYGRILNISSTAAFQPGPGMAVYFASKAYILSLSQALTEELRDTGVSVTALCPGPTVTSFAESANLKNNPIHNGIVPLWHPKEVAEYGYKVMMQGRRVATAGLVNKIFGTLARLAPKGVVMRVLKRLHEQ